MAAQTLTWPHSVRPYSLQVPHGTAPRATCLHIERNSRQSRQDTRRHRPRRTQRTAMRYNGTVRRAWFVGYVFGNCRREFVTAEASAVHRLAECSTGQKAADIQTAVLVFKASGHRRTQRSTGCELPLAHADWIHAALIAILSGYRTTL